MKAFLFGADAPRMTNYDTGIVVLLVLFLLASTFSIAGMNIAYGAAAALWISRRFMRKELGFPKTPIDKFVLAYVCAALLSLAFAFDKQQALLYTYRRLTLLPIIYLFFDSVVSRRVLKILFAALLTAMVAAAVWSCRDVFMHFPEYVLFQRRSNLFQMYMTVGGLMMFGALLLLPFIAHEKTPTKIRWLALVSSVPVAVTLLFSFTRSSWLGFLVGAVVIGAVRARKLFVPLAVVLAVVVFTSSPEMQERMASIVNPYHPNNVTRVQMWVTGLRIVKANPIVGVGDIGTEKVWPLFADPEWVPWGHLHNNLLMWLVTLGVVGFAAIVSLFVKLWIEVRSIEKRQHADWFVGSVALGTLAAMAGFHVNGLFEWNFGDAEIIMLVWALVGLTLGAGKLTLREEHNG